MNNAAALESTPEEAAEGEAKLRGYLAELDLLLEQMAERGRRTELSSVRTETMLDNIFELLKLK